MSSSAKNKILEKIRAALTQSTRLPFPGREASAPVFQPLQQDLVVEFAEQFTQLQGKFHFCQSTEELLSHLNGFVAEKEWTKLYCLNNELKNLLPEKWWTADIVNCDASITGCEALVARTGSILLSANNSGRITSVYAPVHICIAFTSQLVYDIKEALTDLKKRYASDTLPSLISLATGPSRTADIEKTLVVGVHGPKEVYLFLVDDLIEAS